MEIRFSQQEIETISTYLDKIGSCQTQSGMTQTQLYGLPQALPEWNTVFLLLRKLLAYGVHYNVPTDPEMSYEDLQRKSQKPDTMLATVHTHSGPFKHLLAVYTAHHVA